MTSSQSSGSQGTNSQSTGLPHATEASSLGALGEDIRTLAQEATSGKRKPRWLYETLKDAHESVGKPKWLVRERKLLVFGSNSQVF